jgi:hypothetical protein
VTRIYVEAPFVWQLALRQEHAAACEQLLMLASSGAIVLALPLVALIETLNTVRVRTSKQSELNNSWRDAARQLARSDGTAYQEAATALQTALLKTAEMASDERRNLDKVIAQIGSCAQVLLPTIGQFAGAYFLEAKGPTSLDALALACILDDARKLDASSDRALLALDQKAISPTIAEMLKVADIKVFGSPHQLAPWLASKGVTLRLAAGAAERRDAEDRGTR